VVDKVMAVVVMVVVVVEVGDHDVHPYLVGLQAPIAYFGDVPLRYPYCSVATSCWFKK
jgi:hypothetical protein